MNAPTDSPHASWFKRLLAAVIWSLVAAIFGLTNWYFAAGPVVLATGNWNMARNYTPVQAKVVVRNGKDADGSTTSWTAAQYEVNGKMYFAERPTVLDDDSVDEASNSAALKALESARGGEGTTTVWVSPRRPEIALLSRDLPLGSLWPRLPMAIGFTLIALAGVAGVVGALFNPGWYRRLLAAAPIWGFAGAWCGFIMPIFILVASEPSAEGVPVIMVGVFVLIGALLLWGAVAATLSGSSGNSAFKVGRVRSSLPASALATTGGRKIKKAGDSDGKVKRGGMGGHGDDFDKH